MFSSVIAAVAMLTLAGDADIPAVEETPTSQLFLVDLRSRRPRAYDPQPGDIFLGTHKNPMARVLYTLALCGPTATHAGIVVSRPDGTPCILEAPLMHRVQVEDIPSRMKSYGGTMYIRERKFPLTAEQNAKLTEWSFRQVGKLYNPAALLVPTFTLPVKFPFEKHLGPPNLEKSMWMCTSLVTSAGIAGEFLAPDVVRPSGVCAQDLYDDMILDLSDAYAKPAVLRKR